MDEAHHSIKTAALRTGLSAHVLRIWEKRYGAVKPFRTETKRRLYSEEQIERLTLLNRLAHSGHAIGNVARLPTAKLRGLLGDSTLPGAGVPGEANPTDFAPALLKECVVAVKALDGRALEATLNRGAVVLGAQGLLQRVVAPLAQVVGDLWREGVISAAHEHFTSAVLRVFLGHAARPFAGTDNAPCLIVGTPSGQLHELGALLAGAAAANMGWRVTYLGASLPAEELAGAALQNRARAVALSLVYPEDDPSLANELLRLRQLTPSEAAIVVGGRAASAYRPALNSIKALQIDNLAELCASLDSLRKPASAV